MVRNIRPNGGGAGVGTGFPQPCELRLRIPHFQSPALRHRANRRQTGPAGAIPVQSASNLVKPGQTPSKQKSRFAPAFRPLRVSDLECGTQFRFPLARPNRAPHHNSPGRMVKFSHPPLHHSITPASTRPIVPNQGKSSPIKPSRA